MLQHQRIFELNQVCAVKERIVRSLSENGTAGSGDPSRAPADSVLDWTASGRGHLVAFITAEAKEICSLSLGSERLLAAVDDGDEEDGAISFRQMEWFRGEDRAARCIAFSPDEDFLLVAVKAGDLYIVPASLVLPEDTPPPKGGRTTWSATSATLVFSQKHRSEERPRQQQQQFVPLPTSALWFTSHEQLPLAFVGTKSGHLLCVDLATGKEVCCVRTTASAIVRLETIADNANDCTYLLLTAENRSQWRLLLEQRSTGYNWGLSDPAMLDVDGSDGSKSAKSSSIAASTAGSEEVQGLSRSRLSGLKQISVAGLANLRQRISDGKRMMLDGRRGGGGSSGSSTASNSVVEMAEEAIDSSSNASGSTTALPRVPTPESLHPKVGDARVSVQRSSSGLQILAGVFPDSAILTVHNVDLEVVPQSAFKVPSGSDKILIVNRVMIMSAIGASSSEVDNRSLKTSCLHIVSSFHSELHLDGSNTKSEAILQTFTFAPGEVVLAILERRPESSSAAATVVTPGHGQAQAKEVKNVDSSSGAGNHAASGSTSHLSANKDSSPSNVPSSTTASESSSSSASSSPAVSSSTNTGSGFCQTVNAKVSSTRQRGLALFNECVVVTNRAVYALRLDQDPVTTFVELAVRGGSEIRRVEQLALAFGLDAKELLELSADVRLCDRDFTNAISLYRLAGCKHLKVVLKFASSGNVHELLSYLNVLFKTPNLEVTPADRIHLSNLALMAYFQQVLTKSTPTARAGFQQQIRQFLDDNSWFDDCLAVRMATETREWDLLGYVTRSRGLHHEMVDSILAVMTGTRNKANKEPAAEALPSSSDVTRILQEMNSTERNALLACLLSPHNIEAVASSQKLLGRRLLNVLTVSLPLLEEQGLKSVMTQSSPDNTSLRSIYLPLLTKAVKNGGGGNKGGKTDDSFAVMLLTLYVTAALTFLRKQGGRSSLKGHEILPMRHLRLDENGVGDVEVPGHNEKLASTRRGRRALTAGATHVLLRKNDSLVAWGSTGQGVLGQGPSGSRFSTPVAVTFFPSCGIKVTSVSCGKAHSLALTDHGLYAWGSSKHGQLGLGKQRLCEQRPTLVRALANVVVTSIATGQYHSVALDDKGQVWTWGWGVHGQLGSRDIEDVFEPTRVFRRKNEFVTQIEAGYAHTLLLTSSGEVWVFGCGLFGQIGNGENKKVTKPVRVDGLPNPVRLISAGFFHNIVVDEEEKVYTWGCNPQVLRLEAQTKKRERLQAVRKELEQQQQHSEQQQMLNKKLQQVKDEPNHAMSLFKDMRKAMTGADKADSESKLNGNGAVAAAAEQQKSTKVKNAPDGGEAKEKEEDNEMLHLVPGVMCDGKDSFGGGRIVDISCGNQHSMFLTDLGSVYTVGRNTDGQLGINSRKEAKTPTFVLGLREDFVKHIACGADYSVVVAETGSVFAWGSNANGQLGKPPLEEAAAGEAGAGGNKVVVMKTTRRIIRLQNNLQNTCDAPKPVQGINNSVYADGLDDDDAEDDWSMTSGLRQNLRRFRPFKPGTDPEVLLHLTLEAFFQHLDAQKLVKKCLVSDNAQAAAKVSLLSGNVVQAFEFTLQLSVRKNVKSSGGGGRSNLLGERIFSSFFFYLMETRSLQQGSGREGSHARRQLLERLIACWQDQRFSFVLLEKLLLKNSDPLLLQTLVLTLFCPEDEDRIEGKAGPVMGGDGYSGPKLVDLFTPEFCLKIGDTFVKEFKAQNECNVGGNSNVGSGASNSEGRRASLAAGEWLNKLKKGGGGGGDETV